MSEVSIGMGSKAFGLRHGQYPPLRFGPPEPRESIARFRFVPDSYLSNCGTQFDRGMEFLLYIQSLIEEEEEQS